MKNLLKVFVIFTVITFFANCSSDNMGNSDGGRMDTGIVSDLGSIRDGDLNYEAGSTTDDSSIVGDNFSDSGIEEYDIKNFSDLGDIFIVDGNSEVLCVSDCYMKCDNADDGCGGRCNETCPNGYVCNNQRCEKRTETKCGDNLCNGSENACSCSVDCKPICGDGCCTIGNENKNNCPDDCKIDCLKLSYSTYNLLYPGYSEQEVRHFIENTANAGSDFIRIMGLMDIECCRGYKEWVFGPWNRREPAHNECFNDRGDRICYQWPYWNLNEWNEDYFNRLNYIVDLAASKNVRILFTIFAIQENPLQYIGPENILNKLSEFIDELKKRGFADRIHDWEIDNEGGTGLFTPEGDDPDGSIYFEYTRRLGEKIRNTLGGTLYHSGEAPGILSNVYDVYMPHSWGGPDPVDQLGGNGFTDEEGITYIEHIRRDYGKSILPSSDGIMPNLCNDNSIRELLGKTYSLNWIGFEADMGWFTSPDGRCSKWDSGTTNTGKIVDIEWGLAHRVSEIAEEMFSGCKYIRGPIVAFVNNKLNAGESLVPGNGRKSENSKYFFVFQNDCNLVLYDITGGEGNWKPLWASDTGGKCSPKFTVMQRDGNLVVVDINNSPVWASNTDGHSGAYLIVRDDGKVAIVDAAGTIIWKKP